MMPGSGSCRFCSSRQLLYTTNLIELLNAELRNATRNRGQFLNDTAALKRLWLMICNIEDKRAAPASQTKRNPQSNATAILKGRKLTGGNKPSTN